MTTPDWRCPPGERGQLPWCRRLPCPGHKSSAEQRLVARVLAWASATGDDGGDPNADELLQEWWDPRRRAEVGPWLVQARRAIHATGRGLGVPR